MNSNNICGLEWAYDFPNSIIHFAHQSFVDVQLLRMSFSWKLGLQGSLPQL